MDAPISRESLYSDALFASGATESAAKFIGFSAFGNVQLPSAEFNGDTISFKGSLTEGGTYGLIYDDTGTLVSFTCVGGAWTQLHPAVLGMPWIKIVTNVATGGAATAQLALKS